MKHIYPNGCSRILLILTCLAGIFFLQSGPVMAQSCPTTITANSINSYPNTYYPSPAGSLNAGAKSITLGAVTYGSDPISAGDILLVIQMQGAQINSSNNNNYGNGTGSGNGYLNNSKLLAGNMEFVVAANSVSLSGGTLNLVSGLVNSYKNAAYVNTQGQYSFQIIRVPVYNRLKLTGTITVPAWSQNASYQFFGGVLVLYAIDSIKLNGQTISGAGMGFRGGAGYAWAGSSATLSYTDYVTDLYSKANGLKGEGIAGSPRYMNINNVLYNSGSEGYPGGSFGQGAPGNAGGGGTDGNPTVNNENTGGGGGGNGGFGGVGGKAWNSGKVSGGQPGAIFNQASPSRLVLGGGGGAGTSNDATGIPYGGIASSGAAGGAIVILLANTISGTGTINVNGANGNTTVVNDGAGGGGAGGSVLIYSNTGNLSNITVTANGGIGGSNQGGGGSSHGPGGGGGGGVIFSNALLNPASTANGGAPGTTSGGTTNYGAATGSVGVIGQNIGKTQTPTFPLSCTILPLNFLSVTAENQNGLATISWDVSQEANTQGYIVEKSLDGSNFNAIGKIPYKQSSSGINQYKYLDNSSVATYGTIYYRVIAIDASGRSMYSRVVSVQPQTNGLGDKLSVFPNPIKGSAAASFTSTKQGGVNLRLIDMRGALLWQHQYQVYEGHNVLPLDNFGFIPNGIYILQSFDGLKQEQVKIMINH